MGSCVAKPKPQKIKNNSQSLAVVFPSIRRASVQKHNFKARNSICSIDGQILPNIKNKNAFAKLQQQIKRGILVNETLGNIAVLEKETQSKVNLLVDTFYQLQNKLNNPETQITPKLIQQLQTINSTIDSLLNREDFNQAFPITRESYKDLRDKIQKQKDKLSQETKRRSSKFIQIPIFTQSNSNSATLSSQGTIDNIQTNQTQNNSNFATIQE